MAVSRRPPSSSAAALSSWSAVLIHRLVCCRRLHGCQKRGYAGDLTPQLFMWGDNDMHIPLEKPNTWPCKLYATRCWQRQSDGSEYKKPFGGRGSALDRAEGAYSTPANPLVGGEGLAVPSPRTPSHRSPPLLSLSVTDKY